MNNTEIKQLLENIRDWMKSNSYGFTGKSKEIYRDISNALEKLENESKLDAFYKTFVDGMKESPQEFIDITNKFFWDLTFDDNKYKNN